MRQTTKTYDCCCCCTSPLIVYTAYELYVKGKKNEEGVNKRASKSSERSCLTYIIYIRKYMAVFHSIPGSIPPPVDVICGPLAIDNLCTKTYNPVHVIPGSKQNGEALWRIVQSELHTTKKVRLRYNTCLLYTSPSPRD